MDDVSTPVRFGRLTCSNLLDFTQMDLSAQLCQILTIKQEIRDQHINFTHPTNFQISAVPTTLSNPTHPLSPIMH